VRRVIPWGRFATADEIAAVVAFLAGPASAYMTGATVDINGGLRMD
jgi:3-oxoacyl-[acyl-carrier protein] reductase